MRCLIIVILLWFSMTTFAQKNTFPFGNISPRELAMKQYEPDTTAVAVVLDEFGEAHVDSNNDHNIIFEYHVKIKILKQAGISYGDFQIPLYKNLPAIEKVGSVQASSFNLENGSISETKLNLKNVYTQDLNKYRNETRFAVPNVRAGSVIDVMYTIESPFFMNFHPWEFQAAIPKVKSEYWALIPSNYNYSIALKGMLALSKNEHSVVKRCYMPGSVVADCIQYKFAIENVPAFIEEDFMTARSNFLSAIDFELNEIRRFDGRVDKITKTWADVERELAESSSFGGQLKKGKDILDSDIERLLVNESDALAKAQKIFDFIKSSFTWNEIYGIVSDLGIKKAFDVKKGNVADINLSLVAALRYAGFSADPVILSTRRHGVVSELYPVLTDFNYVIARVTINDKVWLLDATEKFIPFGLVPERCLNGNGRVMAAKESYWQQITPASKQRTVATYTLNMNSSGVITGNVQFVYSGYDSFYKRHQIQSQGKAKLFDGIFKESPGVVVKNHSLDIPDDLKKSVVLKLEIEIEPGNDAGEGSFLFTPVIKPLWSTNPFRSSERLYPVDFGVPIEQITIVNLQYPSDFEVDEVPTVSKMGLPGGGGQFLFDARADANRLTVNHSLLISRTLYNASDYTHLKSMFNQVLASQQATIVFKRN